MFRNHFLVQLLVISVAHVIVSPLHAQFVHQGNKLTGSDAIGSALQGRTVALSADGNTAVVGGSNDINAGAHSGSVWVFVRSGSSWTQQGAKLGGVADGQGSSVALSADGNTLLVGAPGDNNFTGAAIVYTRSLGSWRQQGSKLVGTGASGPARQGTLRPPWAA